MSKWAVVLAPALCLLAHCGGGSGGNGNTNEDAASVRTLAYVMSECRVDPTQQRVAARQELRIQSATGTAVIPAGGTLELEDPGRIFVQECLAFGDARDGSGSMTVGGLQRLGVTPDEAGVIYELTDDFSFLKFLTHADLLDPDTEGIFFVRADGTGTVRLGPASREPAFIIDGRNYPQLAFSPDGTSIVYTDRSPEPDSAPMIQIVTLDVDACVRGSGACRRTVVAELPDVRCTAPPVKDHACDDILPQCPIRDLPSTHSPVFVDNDTIGFVTNANLDGNNPDNDFVVATVPRAGGAVTLVPAQGVSGQIIPRFSITGDRPGATLLVRPEVPTNCGIPGGLEEIVEVFVSEDETILQLTSFRRDDTFDPIVTADGRHVLFVAGDPEAANHCQIFSIDTTGANLTRLTHFVGGPEDSNGCRFRKPDGCSIGTLIEDPLTNRLIFYSSCHPDGSDAPSGQIFAMDLASGGITALTAARGKRTDTDGWIAVELPGPFAYPIAR